MNLNANILTVWAYCAYSPRKRFSRFESLRKWVTRNDYPVVKTKLNSVRTFNSCLVIVGTQVTGNLARTVLTQWRPKRGAQNSQRVIHSPSSSIFDLKIEKREKSGSKCQLDSSSQLLHVWMTSGTYALLTSLGVPEKNLLLPFRYYVVWIIAYSSIKH